jgi:hypothetical protein
MNQILDLLLAERARIDNVISILGGEPKPKRGRPRKDTIPKRRERPPGSKNKYVADAVIDKSLRKTKRVVSKATRELMKKAAQKRWAAKKAEARKAAMAKVAKPARATEAA